MNNVVLVDKFDNEIGIQEKILAHKQGILHRAFSIFIFNKKKELMIQKRAKSKYHSGGLWSNTCCSHPKPKESIEKSTRIRLLEEMGFSCSLKKITQFVYKANLEDGLIEYEFDHIFIGTYDHSPTINRNEVEEWKWISMQCLEKEISKKPQIYTYWLKEFITKHYSKKKIKSQIEYILKS